MKITQVHAKKTKFKYRTTKIISFVIPESQMKIKGFPFEFHLWFRISSQMKIKEFPFKMNFICGDKQTNKQTDKQTNKLFLVYVVN